MDKAIQAMQENVIPAANQTKQSFYAPTEAHCGLRILFVGNSITRHGPKPEAGWYNDWGMAATDREKDYVHVLMQKIRNIDPDASFATHSAYGLEVLFEDYAVEQLAPARDFGADLMIFFFGANCPKDYAARTDLRRSFADACVAARTYLDPTLQAPSFWFGGFYIRPEIDAQKEEAARRLGDTYVSLGDIPFRTDTHGGWNHPSDIGMAAIADCMWTAIEATVCSLYEKRT